MSPIGSATPVACGKKIDPIEVHQCGSSHLQSNCLPLSRLLRNAGPWMLNSRPPLILIAADDQSMCEALQFSLQLEGLSVHTHRDGSALLEDAGLKLAACLVLDDRKPHMDAFDLLRRLRARDVGLPVILLTGHATTHLRARAATAGVRLVLEKPLLDNALVDGIRVILGSAWETAVDRQPTPGQSYPNK
jgi:two-component system, LuxR family, response regulator FixJ